jgi:hypothetical protein
MVYWGVSTAGVVVFIKADTPPRTHIGCKQTEMTIIFLHIFHKHMGA